LTEEIAAPCLLLVEGVEEKYFFDALIQHLGLDPNHTKVQIRPLEGVSSLGDKFKAVALTRGFDKVISLGVVRDADDDPVDAFSSISYALTHANLTVPSTTMVRIGTDPSVIVMLLPNTGPGMLEDVCLEAVRGDAAMSCVDDYFQCLNGKGISSFQNTSKSKVQAFLASKYETKLLGIAARAGYWPWDATSFEPIVAFLRKFII